MKIAHIAFGTLLLLGSCTEDSNKVVDMRDSQSSEAASDTDVPTSKKESVQTDPKNAEWTYKVILVSEGNWGYQLFQHGTMVINQTSIPAVQGTLGFDTKEKADKTARFVLEKINRGEIPPTVSQEELNSLNVLRGQD